MCKCLWYSCNREDEHGDITTEEMDLRPMTRNELRELAAKNIHRKNKVTSAPNTLDTKSNGPSSRRSKSPRPP